MKDLRPIHQNGLLTVVQPTYTIISFIKWAVEERMRFILVLSGQTGHRLFFRLLLRVDIGGDKSSWINTSLSSHWFARTTSPSSHPEVLPPRWPLSVTCGSRSFIYLHIVPIHFTNWRRWHCTMGAALRGLMMSCLKEGVLWFNSTKVLEVLPSLYIWYVGYWQCSRYCIREHGQFFTKP